MGFLSQCRRICGHRKSSWLTHSNTIKMSSFSSFTGVCVRGWGGGGWMSSENNPRGQSSSSLLFGSHCCCSPGQLVRTVPVSSPPLSTELQGYSCARTSSSGLGRLTIWDPVLIFVRQQTLLTGQPSQPCIIFYNSIQFSGRPDCVKEFSCLEWILPRLSFNLALRSFTYFQLTFAQDERCGPVSLFCVLASCFPSALVEVLFNVQLSTFPENQTW